MKLKLDEYLLCTLIMRDSHTNKSDHIPYTQTGYKLEKYFETTFR